MGPLAKVGQHGCATIGFNAIAGSCSWLSSHKARFDASSLGSAYRK
jgi:hypothetical protein